MALTVRDIMDADPVRMTVVDSVELVLSDEGEDFHLTPEPITLEPDATIREAAHVIAEKKHNRVPVIEHGRLVGVVTRVDVLDALAAGPEE